MDYLSQDGLCTGLVPVLLGYSQEGCDTARRMFRDFRVTSHVFCRQVPRSRRISLCMKFHLIPSTTDNRLLLEALQDFARELARADVILYLIPCTEEFAGLIWNRREELEPYYVIADRQEMEQVWFGSRHSTRKKGAEHD